MAGKSQEKNVSPNEAAAIFTRDAKNAGARKYVLETVPKLIPRGGHYTSDKLDAWLAEHFAGSYRLGDIHEMKWTQLAALVERIEKSVMTVGSDRPDEKSPEPTHQTDTRSGYTQKKANNYKWNTEAEECSNEFKLLRDEGSTQSIKEFCIEYAEEHKTKVSATTLAKKLSSKSNRKKWDPDKKYGRPRAG